MKTAFLLTVLATTAFAAPREYGKDKYGDMDKKDDGGWFVVYRDETVRPLTKAEAYGGDHYHKDNGRHIGAHKGKKGA